MPEHGHSEFALAEEVRKVLAENERLKHELSAIRLEEQNRHQHEHPRRPGWQCRWCFSKYDWEDGVRYVAHSQSCPCPDMPKEIAQKRDPKHNRVTWNPDACWVTAEAAKSRATEILYQILTLKKFSGTWSRETNPYFLMAEYLIGQLREEGLIRLLPPGKE